MKDPNWENLNRILHEVIRMSPTERGAYFDRACNGDVSLRADVESLLKSHEET